MASGAGGGVETNTAGLGIGLIVVACLIIPFSDALVKLVADRYPAAQLVWMRYGLQTAIFAPVMLAVYGRRAFVTGKPVTQLLRAVFIMGAALCFFSALPHIPLANAIAVFFIQPFIVTALAPLILGERVGVWRWSAVGAGFIGALIIIRPSFEGMNVGTLFALGAGCCFAGFILVTRRLAGGDPPMVTNFLTGLGVTLILTAAIPFVWIQPASQDVPIFLGFAVLGATFSLLVVLAYEYAPAATLAPFFYVELAAAAVAGYLVFGEIPDLWTWIGMSVIAGSGLVIVWREHRLARRSRQATLAAAP